MKVLFKIIKKNFKLLTRSKSSALVVILGPLLLIFLVGIAFDTSNTYNINIGTYSEGYNNLTDSFVAKLKEHNFNIKKMSSELDCVEQIKQAKIHTCIVFPPNMSFDVPNVTNDVTFYIDYSKINLVWVIIDTISEKMSSTESQVSEDLANVLLNKLEFTRSSIFEKRPLLSSMKTQVSDSKAQIQKIRAELDKLDLSMDKDSFKVSDLNAKNDEIKAQIDSLQSDTSIRLAEVSVYLNNTRVKIEKLNTTALAKANVLESLTPVEGNVNAVRFKMERSMNTSQAGWLEMQSAISGFDAALNSVKSKLDSASSTRISSSKDIDTIKSLLDSSANNLNELEKTLNSIDSNIASIKVSNAKDIVNPITTTIKPVSQQKTQLNYLFPSLAVLVIMFISLLLSTTIIMMEKHSPAHFRNFITPTKDITFVLGTYFTNIIIVMVQVIVILIVSSYFFHTQIFSSFLSVILFLLIITSLFTFVGMAIGYLFNSEETATLASISVGTIFLLLSNTLLPLESMPAYISQIAKFNPFVISESLLRKAILFNPPILDLSGEILILLGYGVLLFVFVWLLQKAYKSDYLHKMINFEHRFFDNKKGQKLSRK
jgi:ABC-type multidrug transport system permease subunit